MIWLVTGTPGSGKTYYACRKIDQALAAGKVVVTNVRLSDDWPERVARGMPLSSLRRRAVRKRADAYRRNLLVIEEMTDLLRVRVNGVGEGRWLCVLDEAGGFLDARSWNEGDRKALVRWCQRHRHYGADVLLITQLPEAIDKQVRQLFEELVRLKNLRNFKVCGVRIFPRCRFVAIHTWNTKDRHVLKRESYGLSRRVAELYNTHQLASDLADDVDALVLPRPKLVKPQQAAPVSEAASCSAGPASATPLPPPPAADDEQRTALS